MRVLGVDPGLSRCGVGVVEGPSHRPSPLRVGVVRTSTGQPTAQRLAMLHAALRVLLEEARPDVVAVERVFFNANVRTAMGVGQAAGVVLLCAEQAGLPVVEYTPTQVKLAVAGSGSADKAQVGFMVRSLLRLVESPRPPDAADALALALCHLQHAGAVTSSAGDMSPRLAAAVAAAGPGAQVIRPSR
ncbi:MAG: crossover junction endodeoxyribonuclease RuvC [Euzebyaceae bacterium]|nr:crossover junction endodeoxyribonuclease RuvC [Euzebyaceae bacterium]